MYVLHVIYHLKAKVKFFKPLWIEVLSAFKMTTDRKPFYPWSFHYGEFKIHLLNLLQSPSLGPHAYFRCPIHFLLRHPIDTKTDAHVGAHFLLCMDDTFSCFEVIQKGD